MLSTIKKQILMIGEKPMQTLFDRKATAQTHLQNIPPVVYQTWEVDFFGKTHFAEIESFAISTLILVLNYSPRKS